MRIHRNDRGPARRVIRYLLIAALGIAIPMPAMAQQEVSVADGEQIPNMRPCVDYAGRGALRTVGEPMVPDDPDAIILDAIYSFRFHERATLFGPSKRGGVTLTKAYHSLYPLDIAETVVFTADWRGRDRMVDWEWVWRDHAGRPFLPITGWPDPGSRNRDWHPLAIRQFAKPVSYRNPQPFWPGALSDPGYAEHAPELFLVRGKNVIVRYGLYLSDIPALLKAAKSEPCWR
jgi:hypothetical protein